MSPIPALSAALTRGDVAAAARLAMGTALAALALTGCAPVATESNLSGFGPGDGPVGPSSVAYKCPEIEPAQPNCRVPKYANVGDLIAGERLVQP